MLAIVWPFSPPYPARNLQSRRRQKPSTDNKVSDDGSAERAVARPSRILVVRRSVRTQEQLAGATEPRGVLPPSRKQRLVRRAAVVLAKLQTPTHLLAHSKRFLWARLGTGGCSGPSPPRGKWKAFDKISNCFATAAQHRGGYRSSVFSGA